MRGTLMLCASLALAALAIPPAAAEELPCPPQASWACFEVPDELCLASISGCISPRECAADVEGCVQQVKTGAGETVRRIIGPCTCPPR